MNPDEIARLKADVAASVMAEVKRDLKQSLTRDIVREIIAVMGERFLGDPPAPSPASASESESASGSAPAPNKPIIEVGPTAAERLAALSTIEVVRETCEQPLWTVTLGAGPERGGTRAPRTPSAAPRPCPSTCGRARCRTDRWWRWRSSTRYPRRSRPALRGIYGGLLDDPAGDGADCVEQYGADLISVRLEGTHPEKGDRYARAGGGAGEERARSGRRAADRHRPQPLRRDQRGHEGGGPGLRTARTCCSTGSRQDNYRTIAGAALAYGHCVVAQSPIDVNIGKQINILLTT